jgi:hypothetical protein
VTICDVVGHRPSRYAFLPTGVSGSQETSRARCFTDLHRFKRGVIVLYPRCKLLLADIFNCFRVLLVLVELIATSPGTCFMLDNGEWSFIRVLMMLVLRLLHQRGTIRDHYSKRTGRKVMD